MVALIAGLMAAGLTLSSSPAQANPASDEACLRASNVKQPGVSMLQLVIDRADHHCFDHTEVDGHTPLRRQAQWATPRSGSPCRVLTQSFAAVGSSDEKREAECIASWVEYRRYMSAHEQCNVKVSQLVRQRYSQGQLDRPDLRKICPDPNYGSPAMQASQKAAAHQSNVIMGAFGIGGWLCLGAIILLLGIGGWKYAKT